MNAREVGLKIKQSQNPIEYHLGGGELVFFCVGGVMEGEFCKGSPSYYSILGVPTDSSEDEIRRAYRKLAMVSTDLRKWHIFCC